MICFNRRSRLLWACLILLLIALVIRLSRPSETLPSFSPKELASFLNRTFHENLDLPSSSQKTINSNEIVTTTKTTTITATKIETYSPPTRIPQNPHSAPKTLEAETAQKLREAGITLIFKTGAQEHSSLPIHLSTTFSHLTSSSLLIFSDVASNIGPFPIHDALHNVSTRLRTAHPDFEIYRQIQNYASSGQNHDDLREDPRKGDERKGWVLDKYKFLHMIEESWRLRRGKKWFVFMETDTYLFLPNLIQLLSTLDSSEPHYLGSLVSYADIPFAHGGSGYVLSSEAMRRLLDHGPRNGKGLAERWDEKMERHCCGDVVLALALREVGVEPRGMYPLLNGEKPRGMAFGPGSMWCQGVVSMHHVLPMEISDLWRFEREREERGVGNGTTFSELYHHFVEPNLRIEGGNWDNLSHGPTFSAKLLEAERSRAAKEAQQERIEMEIEHKARIEVTSVLKNSGPNNYGKEELRRKEEETRRVREQESRQLDDQRKQELEKKERGPNWTPTEMVSFNSFENCRVACQGRKDCFQFVFIDDSEEPTCRLGLYFRLGQYHPPSKGGKVVWKSGWMKQKILDWAQNNPCKQVDWTGN